MDYEYVRDLGPNTILRTSNGGFSIPYETLGDASPEDCHPELMDPSILLPPSGVSEFLLDSVTNRRCDHIKGDVLKAYEFAINAYEEEDDEKKILMAEKALKISHACSVAYNIFGFYRAKNNKESIPYFLKTIEVTRLMSDDYDEHVGSCDIAMYPYLRPMFRAYLSLTRCYRGIGNEKKALEMLMKLDSLQKEHKKYATFYNFRYLIPEMMIRVKKYDECLEYMKKHDEESTYVSIDQCWCWTAALLEYIRYGRKQSYDFYLTSDELYDRKLNILEIGNIENAITHFPHIALFLSGEYKLPRISIPLKLILQVDKRFSPLLGCAVYAQNCKDLWERIPGAIEWAMKCVNTSQLANVLLQKDTSTKAQDRLDTFTRDFKSQNRLKVRTRKAATYFIKRGVYSGLFNIVNRLIGSLEPHREKKPYIDFEPMEILVELKKSGVNINEPVPPKYLSSLHTSSFYTNETKYLDVLIGENERSIVVETDDGMTPFSMSVCRGNWRIVEFYLKNYFSVVGRRKYLQTGFYELVGSTFFHCFSGGEKCSLCLGGNKHSKDTDFFRTIDLLVEAGLQRKWIVNIKIDSFNEKLIDYTIRKFYGRSSKNVKQTTKTRNKNMKKKKSDSGFRMGFFDNKKGSKKNKNINTAKSKSAEPQKIKKKCNNCDKTGEELKINLKKW